MVPVCTQKALRQSEALQRNDHQHSLWAPNNAVDAALQSVVPISIVEQNLPSSSLLASHLYGSASLLYQKVLFSVVNNFAGIATTAIRDIIEFLQSVTDEKLYKLIIATPGPSSSAIAQNVFKGAIEIGDARIVDLLLREKAAEIGVNHLFCFLDSDHCIHTPIERATLLGYRYVVEILLRYQADVNRTYDSSSESYKGALECAVSWKKGKGISFAMIPNI